MSSYFFDCIDMPYMQYQRIIGHDMIRVSNSWPRIVTFALLKHRTSVDGMTELVVG